MAVVYTLNDPRTGIIRYVGVTCLTLTTRLGAHIRKSRLGEKTHKAAWVRQLLALDLRPIIVPLEETDDRDREIHWIVEMRKLGVDLTNATDGGDGCRGLSEECRRRIGEAVRRREVTEETRRKISRANMGRVISKETRAKLSQAFRGRKMGPLPAATKRKMSEVKIGHEVSADTRKKISRKLKGRSTDLGDANAAKTHCPNGHPYNKEHTFVNVRGARECLTCRRERDRLRYLARKK